jgi:DNA polymerase elongation subunit (family B)
LAREYAWLVNATYDTGQVHLNLIGAKDLDQIHWVDSFQPYYLTKQKKQGEIVKKIDLFTQNDLTLYKVNYLGRAPKEIDAWEMEVDPALSYAYDKGLRFGVLHRFEGNTWVPDVPLDNDQSLLFNKLFDGIKDNDPLKYTLVKEAYTYASQPVPRISQQKLGISDNSSSEEDYFNAFLLSRIANLPLLRTFRNYSVSGWIRSMLNTYYRAHNILIPKPDELKLGDERKFVTGALTIAPASGTYFNMHVLDYESLYPGCIDVFNLSYETIRCPHTECQQNQIPNLDYHVCTKRRGIYSALVGALRDLRINVFKPLAVRDAEKSMGASARILKLFLVSCFGVTIRIHGLASPLLGEAITAYGRYVLQSTWDMANEMGLKPRYGDTDSVFLDNPAETEVSKLIQMVQNRFKLQLAHNRVYPVCVLSAAKKAYFGILPDGEPEIKGLSIAKSNSPTFFQVTFQKCLKKLSEGRSSPAGFDRAKLQVPEVVKEAIRELREGRVELSDLEYRVELREDPEEKSRSKTLPQPYQAALLLKSEKKLQRGEVVGFIKVHPFKSEGRQFTVKPTVQVRAGDVNVGDYIRNLISSLSQTFEPMSIAINITATNLSDFV